MKIIDSGPDEYLMADIAFDGMPELYDKFRTYFQAQTQNQAETQIRATSIKGKSKSIEVLPRRSMDVQILYDGYSDGSALGHYVVAYRNGSEVLVYDSKYLEGNWVSDHLMERIHRLFPEIEDENIHLTEPRTTQAEDDDTSCGVLSAAYAGTLIKGLNPRDVEFILKEKGDPVKLLRKHYAKILRKKN